MYKHIATIAFAAGITLASPIFVHSALGQSASSAPTSNAKTKKPPTSSQTALRERQRKCGAEWKAAKKAGKIENGMKWPKYWSACNKRLKADS